MPIAIATSNIEKPHGSSTQHLPQRVKVLAKLKTDNIIMFPHDSFSHFSISLFPGWVTMWPALARFSSLRLPQGFADSEFRYESASLHRITLKLIEPKRAKIFAEMSLAHLLLPQ